MLNPEDRIREIVERDNAGRYKRKVFFFTCRDNDCNKEIKSSSSPLALQKHSGYCLRCSRRRNMVPFRSLYNSIRRSAKRRDPPISFDLSFEDFLFLVQIKQCAYCGGTDIEWHEHLGPTKSAASNLDRIDNSKGYSLDNVVVCCKECNWMKGKWYSGQEFTAIRLLLDSWRRSSEVERNEIMLYITSLHAARTFPIPTP